VNLIFNIEQISLVTSRIYMRLSCDVSHRNLVIPLSKIIANVVHIWNTGKINLAWLNVSKKRLFFRSQKKTSLEIRRVEVKSAFRGIKLKISNDVMTRE